MTSPIVNHSTDFRLGCFLFGLFRNELQEIFSSAKEQKSSRSCTTGPVGMALRVGRIDSRSSSSKVVSCGLRRSHQFCFKSLSSSWPPIHFIT